MKHLTKRWLLGGAAILVVSTAYAENRTVQPPHVKKPTAMANQIAVSNLALQLQASALAGQLNDLENQVSSALADNALKASQLDTLKAQEAQLRTEIAHLHSRTAASRERGHSFVSQSVRTASAQPSSIQSPSVQTVTGASGSGDGGIDFSWDGFGGGDDNE